MSALIQSQLGLPINGSRRIGANLKQSRQARQAILSHPGLGRRFFIAAAAETEVTDEPPVDAPATSSNPAAREKRSGGNFRRRNNNQRKPLIGPERTLKLDALEVGKNYEGNVVTVTDFGAFVNVGCETDGLLHISQISVDFVRNVADVISIGQPITVRVINVDTERKKFAVTAIPEGEEPPRRGYSMSGGERGDEGEAGSGRRAPPRQARIQKDSRRSQRRSCPVAVGDTVTGKISGIAPYGVFVEVAEGFTGMLHVSQMKLPEGVEDHVGHLSEGSTVEVRVAGIAKGGEKISLTQKSEEELAVEEKTRTEGLSANVDVPEGSGPMAFLLAKAGITPDMFETRKDVSSDVASTQQHEPVAEEVNEAPVVEEVNEAPVAEEQQTVAAESKGKSASETAGISAGLVKQLREASGAGMMDCKKALAECNGDLEAAKDFLRKKGLASADKKAGRVAADGAVWSYIHAGSRLGVLVELNCETDFVARGEKFKELVNDIAMQIAACPQVTVVSATDVPAEVLERERTIEMEKEDLKSKPDAIREKIVQGRVDKIAKEMALLEQPFIKDTGKSVAEHIKQQIATIGENIQIRRFERYNLGEGIEVAAKGDFAAEVEAQTSAMAAKAAEKKSDKPEEEKAPAEKAQPAVAISAAVVKQLREASGAGMMDCKKALAECNGDLEAAKEYLRKKGLASADKKAGRVAAEGAVGAYIHAGSRLGVLVELNCETDFVARGEKFKELVNDIAMQIAACPQVTVVSATDVPAEVLERERAIEMEKEDLKSKPDAIREKIVQGRVDKIAKEMALLEQPFIKDTGKSVAEHIKEQIATIGENIQIRRFERYVLGEGVEKKVTDFAAEVAAQTGMAM